MPGRARYAPSPTGPLHLGNLRTALLCWLHARVRGSTLVLRIEDTDTTRCRPTHTAQMLDDLRWLGLDWDEGPDEGGDSGPYVQSQRFDRYAAALSTLVDRGLAYPCACSRKSIRAAAEATGWQPGTTLVYPGTCAGREPAEVLAACEATGRTAAWRFRVPTGVTTIHDGVAGAFSQDVEAEVGDFALRRADGVWAYQLAVVVDDRDQGITEIVRGADLLDSTPRQALLFDALGGTLPETWHVPLMCGPDGRKLSKRDLVHAGRGHPSAGAGPEGLLGWLAASVALQPTAEACSAAELLAATDEAALSAALSFSGRPPAA